MKYGCCGSRIAPYLAAMLVVLAASNDARAESPSPTIVLRTQVGQPQPGAEDALEPLIIALEARGFAAQPATITHQLAGRAPLPGILDPEITPDALRKAVEKGYDQFTGGTYADAATTLAPTVRFMRRNPALFVLDANNGRLMFKALASYALSQDKLGASSESVAIMTELIRMFPGVPLPRAEYGPNGVQFYRKVEQGVGELGRGRMTIAVNNKQAVIFWDGQIRGAGRVALADQVPGPHHVFVQVPGTPGRQFEMDVKTGAERELSIGWDAESTVLITDAWVGMVFESEAERTKEAGFATALARAWGTKMIAVVGRANVRGQPAVVGTLYDETKVVRSGAVLGEDVFQLQALAHYLVDGTPKKEVVVLGVVDSPVHAVSSRGRRLLPVVVIGAGIATIATGGYLLAIDEDDDGSKFQYRDTGTAGVAVMAGGAIVVGLGAWLWTRGGDLPAPVVSVRAGGALIGLAGHF